MKTQVKLFNEASEVDMEAQINDWLQHNDVIVKDIKFGNWFEVNYDSNIDQTGVNALLIYQTK